MADRKVVLIGGETLLGADVRDLLRERFPRARVKLAGSQEEDTAILTEVGGEAVVLTGLDEEALASADLVILAGSADAARRADRLLRQAGVEPPLIDLGLGLEDRPEARLRAPFAEPPSGLAPARLQVVAHPAAILTATVLRALESVSPVARSVVQLFAPASEFGRPGVDELQRQTMQLLAFQPLPQTVFGTQLSFNLIAGMLHETEQRVERHVASLLSAGAPVVLPSIRMTQAGVMHGYSASIWVEFRGKVEALGRALQDEGLDVWPDSPPSVLSVAGQNGIALGTVEPDRNNRRAFWIWAVADNYRLSAENAMVLAEPVLS